jgi:DNA-binding NtrC family response regulator
VEGEAAGLRVELPDEGVSLQALEKTVIKKAYEKCGRNKSKTARFLSIPRHVLLYRLKKYGIGP